MTKEQKHYNLGFDAGLQVSLIKMHEIVEHLKDKAGWENIGVIEEMADYIDEQLSQFED